MHLPNDPIMLLSVVNTQLRDRFSSLDALADDCGISPQTIADKLAAINYHYDEQLNQFK